MLANLAAWIAEEAAYFGIPIVALTPDQAQDPAARGVCQHVDLGSMGGGHVDCGDAFPLDHVLEMAKGADMPLSDDDKTWITNAINTALRQQFAPSGECYGRGKQFTNDAIHLNAGNFVGWAETGADKALGR
jgi:hypothetical protein